MSACLPRLPALRLAPRPPTEATCTSSSSQVPWEATQLGPLGPGWTLPAGPSGPVSWGPEFPQTQAGKGGWPPPPAMKTESAAETRRRVPGRLHSSCGVGPLCGRLAEAQHRSQERKPVHLHPKRRISCRPRGQRPWRPQAASWASLLRQLVWQLHAIFPDSLPWAWAWPALPTSTPISVPSCPAQEGTQQERQTTDMHSLPESGVGVWWVGAHNGNSDPQAQQPIAEHGRFLGQ